MLGMLSVVLAVGGSRQERWTPLTIVLAVVGVAVVIAIRVARRRRS
ncbi:MAG TPA: hypothetical protein VK507_06985 [Iamia sp.]|nr:hypothetical protein [Iamia sp.]